MCLLLPTMPGDISDSCVMSNESEKAITNMLCIRAEAQSKMTMMREKAVKDLAQYNTEMKELERVIAHEFSLKEFLSTKCDERMSRVDSQEMGHKQCKTAILIQHTDGTRNNSINN